MIKYQFFSSESYYFCAIKNRSLLHRRVIVMQKELCLLVCRAAAELKSCNIEVILYHIQKNENTHMHEPENQNKNSQHLVMTDQLAHWTEQLVSPH